MTDYSNKEGYLWRGEFVYRPDRYYYPVGNSSRQYPKNYGAGRPQINYSLSNAGQTAGNPFVDQTCFLQAPINYMETVPYDKCTGKFTDTFFYKHHRFAPGSN
jgi:hypothetical protein